MGIVRKRPSARRDTDDNDHITVSRTMITDVMQEHTKAISNHMYLMDQADNTTQEQAEAAMKLAASTLRLTVALTPYLTMGERNEYMDLIDSSNSWPSSGSNGLD